MNREFGLILAVALLAGVLGLAAGWWMQGPAPLPPGPEPALQAGEAVPAIELPDLEGATQPLAQWRGRPLLVNFWASWCAPCIEEMPLLDAFARANPGVQVVGIALDEPAAVRGFLEATPVAYPILLDRPAADDSSVRLGNARGVLPYSVLIGADGRLVATHLGPFDAAQLAAFVARATGPAAPTGP